RRESARQAGLLHSCVQIVGELRGSLNMADGGTLAQNLADLYEYMIRRLLLANAASDVAPLIEVQRLLDEIRSAWVAIGPQVKQTANAPAAATWNAQANTAAAAPQTTASGVTPGNSTV